MVDEDLNTSDEIEGGMYPSFTRYMEQRFEEQQQAYLSVASSSGYARELQLAAELYRTTEKFEVGQLIQWKTSMRNRPYPAESVPVVIVEVLNPPVTLDTDGEHLIEPRDLLVGFLDGDRIFRLTQVPSARFRSFKP